MPNHISSSSSPLQHTSTAFNVDNLPRIVEQFPLAFRLETARQVSDQWAEVVAQQCSAQKTLTLQIGGGGNSSGNEGNRWTDFRQKLTRETALQFAVSVPVNPFLSLTVSQLTEEVITTLVSTFPRLEKLTILVDEQQFSETLQPNSFSSSSSSSSSSSLAYLPSLISSLSLNHHHQLTELWLVFGLVDCQLFHQHFQQLIYNINDLSSLKLLALIEINYKLKLPSFDRLTFLRSVDTVLISVHNCSRNFLLGWGRYLHERKSPMKIYFNTVKLRPVLSSPKVTAHIYLFNCRVNSVEELERLCRLFTNLRTLILATHDMPSLTETLTQLSRLPHLTNLFLLCEHRQAVIEEAENNDNVDDDDDDGNDDVEVVPALAPAPLLLPSLPTVRHLKLVYKSATFKHADLAGLRSAVFPNLRSIKVSFITETVQTRNGEDLAVVSCADCDWRLELDGRLKQENSSNTAGDQLRQCQPAMRQCLTQFSAHFATTMLKFSFTVFLNSDNFFVVQNQS